MAVTPRHLSLKDRLAHASYRDVKRWLGDETDRLLREGGQFEVDLAEQVLLERDRFELRLPEATAVLRPDPARPKEVLWECSRCRGYACAHVGAAFALVLEDKMALGLAKPPPERVPVESLSEAELEQAALAVRQEKAETERMTVKPAAPGQVWTDYTVSNPTSGRTYRVALRGLERGDSFCSCPDFRTNTLGTCKHILKVQAWVAKSFTAKVLRIPHRPDSFAVHLRYGREVELRLLTPEPLPCATEALVEPVLGKAVSDVHALLHAVGQIEAAGHRVTIYPDAEETIQQWLYRDRIAARVAEIRRDPASHPLRRELLKTELLPYQLEGIAFAVGAGRAVLADDMGLGKTIQGVGVAELLAREAAISRVLVICPVSLKSQWRSEIQRFSERSCQLVLGTAAERAGQYGADVFFTIVNYEQVMRDIVTIERTRWDLIMLDEGQRIKNWEAKTTRIVKGLRSPFALVLTGTPLENRLEELYSVVSFVDERRLGPAFRFLNTFRITDERGKVLGYKNLDTLRARIKPILLRRTRGMVARQLPPRSTEIVRITPTSQQLEVHGGHMLTVASIVRKRFLTEMDLLRLQKALLMCRLCANGTFLVDKQYPGYSSKLEVLRGLLPDLAGEADRKVILFSEWTSMLDAIEPILTAGEVGYVRLDGSVPQKQRAVLVKEFQEKPACRFFLTTNAGATGLNLQAANTIVNVDLPWNPAVLEQRISRAHRMGQQRPVQVYLLVTEDTIEENLLGTLSAKHELALAALDPATDVNRVDLQGGMEELKRRLEVLLGQKPPAPSDLAEKERVEAEAHALTDRKERIASAGGQLLSAAFAFMGELLPKAPESAESARLAADIERGLVQCVEQDDRGALRLTVALPSADALQALARSLASLLAASPPCQSPATAAGRQRDA
jgi:superfamily II DNA or RNA helicase